MATLQKIVASLAARVDQPFNVDLQEELKHIIAYKRAAYTQQFIQKHPEQRKFFIQKLTAELEKVPSDDCEPVEGCEVLRTKCVVPTPVRNSSVLFDFVGPSTHIGGYGEIDPSFVQDLSANRFTGKRAKWYFMNNRIYVYNDTTIKRIGIRGVFQNPSDVNACACDDADCFKDTDEFPIAEDLLNAIIRDTIKVELGRPLLPEEEVSQDKIEEMEDMGLKPELR